MKEFFTLQASNEGKRIYLFKPNGEKTEHWLHVLGTDSDAYREGGLEMRRKMRVALAAGGEVSDAFTLSVARENLACLVKDWSFPEPCTRENVVNFFKQAPRVQDYVEEYCGVGSNFFGEGSTSSVNGTNNG